jgi:fatty-acyl-CoA synthase
LNNLSANPFSMGDFVDSWARWEPDAPAIRHPGGVITWSELNERTNRVTGMFAARGIAKGDRIAAMHNNAPEFLETVIACMKLGAIFVPINPRLAVPEVTQLLAHSDASLLITDPVLHERAAPAAEQLERLEVICTGDEPPPSALNWRELITSAEPPATQAEIAPDDPLFICYTSGTTGVAKGAVLTHRNALQPALNQILIHEVGKSDRLLLPFPLAFTGGLLSNAMLAYVSGAELVLEPTFEPARALQILVEQRITVFMAVPVIWQAIAALAEFGTADLSALKVAKSGGAPVPVPLLKTYQAKGVEMIQGYALTEGSGITTTLHARDGVSKLGSTGIPTNGTRLRIVDEQGAECPTDVVGEVQVRGPEVMLGYWNDPEATAQSLRDGWLATGDLGRIDADGHLWIVDRKKDMLICGGINVYPAEIERVIEQIDGVQENAVIGVPHPRWSEVPAAIIFSPGPLRPEASEIVERCREQLADFKVPHYVVFSEDPLPRTMSGKLLKRELATRYRDLPDQMDRIRVDGPVVSAIPR